jgi:WS/DGAT/MGAT family acyltransferase
MPVDPPSIFRGECAVPKLTVWSRQEDLAELKKISRKIDGTTNDVLLSAITGALRQYAIQHNEPYVGYDIRAFVPFNLRSLRDLYRLGNEFGVVFFTVPLGISDPIQRLNAIKSHMDELKQAPDATITYGLFGIMGASPEKVKNVFVDVFSKKCTLTVTNVPGPRQLLYISTSQIEDVIFWVPSPVNMSLGISIISYNSKVVVGVVSDKGIIPDPERIIDNYHSELDLLKTWYREDRV